MAVFTESDKRTQLHKPKNSASEVENKIIERQKTRKESVGRGLSSVEIERFVEDW